MSEPLELLFFDTFSHEPSDELNVDLVQFPKPVYVGEIRIIPLGARVHADFPGGVRLGATNPSQFKIEFFENDLSKPGASTFQQLGSIEYNENGRIHLECDQRHIPTDGLILRGWYTTITLAVYGVLAKATAQPVEPAQQEMVTVDWLQQHPQMQGENRANYSSSTGGHYASYSVSESGVGSGSGGGGGAVGGGGGGGSGARGTATSVVVLDTGTYRPSPITQSTPFTWHQVQTPCHHESYEPPKDVYLEESETWTEHVRSDDKHWDARKDKMPEQSYRYDRRHQEERSPEYREKSSPQEYDRGGGDFFQNNKRRNWGSEWSGGQTAPVPSSGGGPSGSAASNNTTVPVTTGSKRPHTPPPPAENVPDSSPNQGGPFDDLSPGDVESISEGDIPETEGPEETGNKTPPASSAGSTVPSGSVQGANSAGGSSPRQQQQQQQQQQLAPPPPPPFEPILSDDEIIDDQDLDYDFTEYAEDPLKSFNPYNNEIPELKALHDPASPFIGTPETTSPGGQALLDLVASVRDPKASKENWVETAGEVIQCLNRSFPGVAVNCREPLVATLVDWVKFGLDFNEAFTQPQPGLKVRHIKTGVRLVEALVDCGEEVTLRAVVEANAQNGLMDLYERDYMALVIKLMILRALDATLRYKSCVEIFVKLDESNKSGYVRLLEMIQQNQHARVKFSLNSLLQKLNFYDMLTRLKTATDDLESKLADIKTGDFDEDKFNSDSEFLALATEEITRVYIEAHSLISQPRRHLPVSAQFEVNSNDFPDPYRAVYSYFRATFIAKSFVSLLRLPNQSILAPVTSLIAEMLETDDGLRFLASSSEINEVIRLLLGSSAKLNENGSPGVNPTLGLHLAYRLRALGYLDDLSGLRGSDPDKPEVLDILQSLFNLTLSNIGNIGKSSVVHILCQSNNLDILLHFLKQKTNKKRSPSRGFITDLIILCVKLSTHVPFLQKYAETIGDLLKNDFPELSVVRPWFTPVENVSGFDVSSVCHTLKNYVDACVTLPPELISTVRLLCHLGVPRHDKDLSPLPPLSDYVELKYKFVILQLYSFDGLAQLTVMLQKLCKAYEQPHLYSSRLIARQGLLLLAFVLPAVQLIRRMLTYVIRTRNTDFKDLSAVSVLLQTFNLMQAVPLNAQAHTDAVRVCREIIETLLAYTQPVSRENSTETEALNKSLWTSMISEVVKFTTEAPMNFTSGLMVISELLPLPLPVQSRASLSENEHLKLVNLRRLWSAHLHSLHPLLETMITTLSLSSCPPLIQILRRVCVQLADLAAPTALMIVRTLYDSISLYTDDPQKSASLSHLLNFLACLMSHGAVKAAFLHLSKTNDKYQTVLNRLLEIFKTPQTGCTAQLHNRECIASVLLSLCDSEVSLVSLTSNITPEVYMANSLPTDDTLIAILTAMREHISQAASDTFGTCLTVIRAFTLLIEHDYGLYHVKTCLEKNTDCLHTFLTRLDENWSKENHDVLACVSASLDFLRALVCCEGVEYPSKTHNCSFNELRILIKWGKEHPLRAIENHLKVTFQEDESLEPLLENLSSLMKLLDDPDTTPVEIKAELSETILPPPESLLGQFALRSVSVIGDFVDDRLTAAFWLSPPKVDDVPMEIDQVAVDLNAIAKNDLNGFSLSEAVANLLDPKLDARGGGGGGLVDVSTADEKKAKLSDASSKKLYVVPTRGRNLRPACIAGSRSDVFRSRPPNTSRPPSLHVDDFVALETCGGPTTVSRSKPCLPLLSLHDKSVMRVRGRGRGGPVTSGGGGGGGGGGGRFFPTHHQLYPPVVDSVWERGMYVGGGGHLMDLTGGSVVGSGLDAAAAAASSSRYALSHQFAAAAAAAAAGNAWDAIMSGGGVGGVGKNPQLRALRSSQQSHNRFFPR